MAIKTLRVFQEVTSSGYIPMPVAGNIDYGVTVASTFPSTTPSSFQTDDPDIDVTLTATTDYYVWVRSNGSDWNPMFTRNVRVYPDSPLVNNVVMGIIILKEDDSAFVKIAETQTITGTKTFQQAPKVDIGIGFKEVSGTIYNYMKSIFTGWEMPVNGWNHKLLFSRDSNYDYTFPSASGTVVLSGTSPTFSSLSLSNTNGNLGSVNSSNANGGSFEWQTSGTAIADIGAAQKIFGSDGSTNFGISTRGSRSLIFGTNNTPYMRISALGNIIIGGSNDNTSKVKIEKAGSSLSSPHLSLYSTIDFQGVHFLDESAYYIGQISNSKTLRMFSGGGGSSTTGVNLAAGATSWGTYSDERLKTDLTPIVNATEKVSQLRSMIGRYKTDDETKTRSFLIAQDVKDVLPEAVSEDLQTGMLEIRYTEVIPLLVASIKELKTKIETLENK
jgi:hypothetical protein